MLVFYVVLAVVLVYCTAINLAVWLKETNRVYLLRPT